MGRKLYGWEVTVSPDEYPHWEAIHYTDIADLIYFNKLNADEQQKFIEACVQKRKEEKETAARRRCTVALLLSIVSLAVAVLKATGIL